MALLTRYRNQVSLALRRPIVGLFDGVHQAVNAGRSLDFNDLREYVRGDDVADIDWKASARNGELLVKRHVAERRATLLLAVATGRDLAGMASPRESKLRVAIGVAATLGSLAVAHGDYVGLLRSSGSKVHLTRPSPRPVALERMLGEIVRTVSPHSPEADLDRLLEVTAGSIRRRGMVAVICGDIDIDPSLEARLRRLSRQHDVLLISIGDLDPTVPALNGRMVLGLDDRRILPEELRRDPELATQLRAERQARLERRSSVLTGLRISQLSLESDENVVPRVLDLVRRHRRAR